MVQRATGSQARAWNTLPTPTEMSIRRISSVFLMGALLTIITPFTPFAWLSPVPGPEFLDGFLTPPIILGGLFAQWRIAGVITPLRIEALDYTFFYHHSMYWRLAFFEVVLAVVVGVTQHEVMRRFSAVGAVGGLWMIGWACTPQRTKDQAWEYLKVVWMWMAIDQAIGVMRGGRAGGRRRWN